MEKEVRLIDADTKFIEKHFTKRLVDIYALVDVIENTDWYHISPQGKLAEGANSQRNTPLYKAADIHRALANAPTVDAVEVKHGRWIDVRGIPSVNRKDVPVVRCSKCEIYFCDLINNHHFMYNYCPSCGAKMDGDGNG